MTPTRRSRLGRRRSQPTLALAGAGYIAVVHALAAAAAGVRVTAVASAGGSSARHLAGELDARRCRPQDLPSGADLMVVATPPDHHVSLALQGIEAGAAVLVEKPLATTLADADRLVDAARAGTSTVRCAENLLHSPAWRAAMDRRAGHGPLGHLSVRTLQPPPDWGHFAGPLHAGGVLFDLGPHPVALALAVADEAPVGVTAQMSSTRDDGADDDAHLEIRFGSGLVATLHVSWTSPEPTWDLQAAGDELVLRWELLPELRLEHNGDEVALTSRFDAADPRLEQFGYVDQLLDTLGPSGVGQTVEQAVAVLEVICAAYASAGSGGSEVALPFTGDRSRTPMQHWRG